MSKRLPFVTSDIPRDLRSFLDRVRELVSGGGADRLLTPTDLVDAGIAQYGAGGVLQPTSTYYATPPAPTNVAAAGAVQNIIITWDTPNYPGHAYAEVWVSDTDNIGTAVLLGSTPGAIYVHSVGPSSARYYWVRFVNVVDTAGAYNAVDGTYGATGSDVAYLLSTLTGQLTEAQLYTSLNSRIDLIDGSGAGSVNARINTEATTRQSADTALSNSITTLSSTVANNTTAIQTEATTRANADGTLFAQYTVKIDTNGYVSGYGLASTSSGATPTSTFAVRSDAFYVASPSGPGIAPAMPFIVRTTATTINGVSVPAGVYMTDAFIQNGTITNAKIGNAAIDDAKIANLDAAKITTGYLNAARIQTGSIDAKIASIGLAQINTASITSLSALSANMGTITAGTIRLPASGNSYLLVDGAANRIEVYNNGVLRLRIGNLA